MNILLICIGKTDEKPLEELISKYEKRLPSHWNYQRIEIPDLKNRKNLSESQQKEKEAELILAKINPTDFVILLDEKGKQLHSTVFAASIQELMNLSVKQIVFLIGGPYGFADEIYARANRKLSLSQMTFTHQMVRLFLVEQLYRAFAILQGKPYHHE
ncbi:23S rRNA (pseudouridine(1915)-N(3))-methyltransferase RlmH [Moheibacter lacus]|uniref:Ribosomal RNA large subunit methyltransferase H n=1 Tax=Moheibacter lacus TaxID=2745851 RepID=A0A838ZLJ5_9FLAO|nr:23S rRNA (pseudouridine(1915)-N(3))-methyltransferase RlmH [Moheibacter lacus]MBA5628620.1 23S rRNA (pseudouridine(1915)-N(3))-methyltransferase RlmH [Moheibacter lacus]